MYIGAYLAEIGLHQRALQVYQQAAQLDPLRPEPYMLGLRAARAVDDLDGLKWASLGILRQAWPERHFSVWQADWASATKCSPARKKTAPRRPRNFVPPWTSCGSVIAWHCTWTGDADIDVWSRSPAAQSAPAQPRTTGGGILLGDALLQTHRDGYGGHSEVYVCPRF
jgi:hypothetical protein